MNNNQEESVWECNACGEQDGVENGVCANCGPTQTTPIDENAKKESGFYEAEAEKKAKAESAIEGEVVEEQQG